MWPPPPAQSTFCVVYPLSCRRQDGFSAPAVDGAGRNSEHMQLRTRVSGYGLFGLLEAFFFFHRWSWLHEVDPFQKGKILAYRFGSCATFAKRRSDSSEIHLNWHPQPRLGLRGGEQSVGQIQKVTLELRSVGQSVARWGHSGGRSQAQADLALLGQPVDDLRLKVGVVDARLPEGPGVAVLLPVVVPVALLVGAVAEHRHLYTDGSLRRRPSASYQRVRIP